MRLPERHQSFIAGKMRKFYLLPIVWYPTSKKLTFRWELRSFEYPHKVHWTYYLWLNIKCFIFLPYMLASNLFYFGETGFVYKDIDYDQLYG